MKDAKKGNLNVNQTKEDEKEIDRNIKGKTRRNVSGNKEEENDEESDRESNKGRMFGHESTLSQDAMDKLA